MQLHGDYQEINDVTFEDDCHAAARFNDGRFYMEITIRASTTHGKKKKVNQDNYGFRCLKKNGGWAAFSIVCDGVGGLSQGEKASEMVTQRYLEWFDHEFIKIYDQDFDEKIIESSWEIVLQKINFQLHQVAEDAGIQLGTTAAVLLICNNNYYCMNIGDTRIYSITDKIEQISVDHSLLQMKLDDGTISIEDAESFTEKNVLFQCIGFSEMLKMTFRTGTIPDNSVWLVCSDGFRNRILDKEIFLFLNPEQLHNNSQFCKMVEDAVRLNLQRNERDDITLVAIWLIREEILGETETENNAKQIEKENDDMYCSKCGCKCGDDDRFCSRCGALLAGNAANYEENVKDRFRVDKSKDINNYYTEYSDEDDDETQVSGASIHLDYDDTDTQLLGDSSSRKTKNERTSEQNQYPEKRGLATKKVEKGNTKKTRNKNKITEKNRDISRTILTILCVILVMMILMIIASTVF